MTLPDQRADSGADERIAGSRSATDGGPAADGTAAAQSSAHSSSVDPAPTVVDQAAAAGAPPRGRRRRTARRISERFGALPRPSGIRIVVPAWARRLGIRTRRTTRVVQHQARRGWTAAEPALRILSPIGWLTLACAVAAFAVGRVLGWQEFVYLGLTLLAGLLIAVAFVFGRSSYAVLIELTPRRVVAGERALGRLVVTNTGAKKSTPTRVELPVGTGLAEFVIPPLEPRAEHEELYAVPTQRRAVIVAGPAISVRGDQLGLLRRTVRWTDPVELFVHPRTARLTPSASGLVRDLEGEPTKTITNTDISFHALRAYEPGDDRRYVHWRTSARTGQLMVRQFEETRRSQLTIVHDLDRRHYLSDDEFELAVSITASLAVQVIREGTRLSVVSELRELRTRTPTALLDDSCRLDLVTSRFEGVREAARVTTLRLPPPSIAVLVTGSLLPLTEFRAVERLFGLDTQTIGFRAEPGGQSRLSLVSGLRVATVGVLDELGRLVRRTR